MWKPIEEAPKDGTLVLVCNKKNYVPIYASFRHYHPNQKAKAQWRNYHGHVLKPTHFMPLPEPPKD